MKVIYLFIFRDFYLFSEKGKRGRKRGRETLMCEMLPLNQAPGLQPRHVPRRKSEPVTFHLPGSAQSTEPPQPGHKGNLTVRKVILWIACKATAY